MKAWKQFRFGEWARRTAFEQLADPIDELVPKAPGPFRVRGEQIPIGQASARELIPDLANRGVGISGIDLDAVPAEDPRVDLAQAGRVDQGAVNVQAESSNRVDDHRPFSTSSR